MRVTSGMLITNLMRNYNRNLESMESLQNELSSGKRIRRPSDDPSGAAKALKLRSDLSVNEQYVKNADNALSWLSKTETALRDIGDSLHRARELTVRAANETFTHENRSAIADEIAQVRQHIFQLANSTYAGRYIFAGYRTDYPAFTQGNNEIIFNGNVGDIEFEVGIGIRIPVNVTGSPPPPPPPPPPPSPPPPPYPYPLPLSPQDPGVDIAGMYANLQRLETNLRDNSNPLRRVDSFITAIDEFSRQALAHRSAIGAKTNRFEMIRTRLMDSEVNFTELLSKNEDTDIARVVMHLKEAEAVYNASLAAGARIIQPTLVDFLR